MSNAISSGTDLDTYQEEVARQEEQRCNALISGDTDRLATMIADDLIHIHGTGQVEGKVQYLEGLRTKYRFRRVDRTYGSVVIVTGPILLSFSISEIDGELDAQGLLTQIWTRKDSVWRQNIYHMQFLKLNGKVAF
jgi:ketosteroid isomerase-like protein